jgi:hypothetical protein
VPATTRSPAPLLIFTSTRDGSALVNRSNDINHISDDVDCATLVYVTAVHVEVDLEARTVSAVFVDDDSVVLLDEPRHLDPRDRAALTIAEHESWPPWRIGF